MNWHSALLVKLHGLVINWPSVVHGSSILESLHPRIFGLANAFVNIQCRWSFKELTIVSNSSRILNYCESTVILVNELVALKN